MITAQIATIPSRIKELSNTITSLYDQVFQVNVYLNGHKTAPDFLKRPKIKYEYLDNSKGDAAKFRNLSRIQGYIFTCDDDLIYPRDYVEKMIHKIEEHKKKYVISCHGRILKPKPIDNYYHSSNRVKQLRCLGEVEKDEFVHVAGTGCMAFHHSTFSVNYRWFKKRNMADIWIAKFCKEQRVKQLVMSHKMDWIKHQKTPTGIFEQNFQNCQYQTDLYNSF